MFKGPMRSIPWFVAYPPALVVASAMVDFSASCAENGITGAVHRLLRHRFRGGVSLIALPPHAGRHVRRRG